jgi:hypothetical protein
MVLPVLGILFILGGIVSTLFFLYYFFYMLACVRPEKRRLIQFLGPFMLLFPQLWNDDGNRARRLFLLFVFLFGVCFAADALIANYMHLSK